MEITSESGPGSAPIGVPSLWPALHDQSLRRFSRGLLATALFEDLRSGDPFTLLAPVDSAFDSLPFRFDRLLLDSSLVEARFDVFEYLVLRGRAEAVAPRGAYPTLQGELVRLAPGLALGRFGASRILSTFVTGEIVVHVLEQCLFPIFPGSYLVDMAAGRRSR